MNCIFCQIKDYILENDLAYAIYDKYPVGNGHMLFIPKRHVKNIKDTLEENKKTCPKCKSELVERTGAYGKFFGCSSYPKCRYTYKEI